MLLPWIVHYLVLEHFEGLYQLGAGFGRFYYLVDKATLCGAVWIGKYDSILLLHLFPLCVRVGCGANLAFKDDLGSTFGAHNRYLGTWPGIVYIGADMFGVHY